MTRQEQLSCLTDRPCAVCKYHSDNGCSQWKCVFEEQPCDDAISRQAALYAIRAGALSTATLYGRTEEGKTARKEIENLIKDLPSVSTEKTGRWIKNNDDHYDWYECSECGYGSEGEITTENGVIFNYCPICGAKMGVEKS